MSPEKKPLRYIQKPLGFSYFPVELFPVPKSWVETTGNLVFWREHQQVCVSCSERERERERESFADCLLCREAILQLWRSRRS